MLDRQDALNDALARMEGVVAFTMEPIFSEHVPMVAETISYLGHDDAVASWVEDSIRRHRHRPPPPPAQPIDGRNEAAWRNALGDAKRMTDWFEFFHKDVRERSWQETGRTWVPRLIDGYIAGLSHGLIRTAHAVRAMPDGKPTALQLDELARGLAFWAGNFANLPGDPDRTGEHTFETAVRAVPRFAEANRASDARPPGGAVPVPAARFAMPDAAGFAAAVESLAPTHEASDAISRHTATFARMLLTHGDLAMVPQIQLVHTVTSASALRLLLPHLQPEVGARAYRRAWQFGASVVARIAPPRDDELTPDIADPGLDWPVLADRAIAHRDDHVIKLTETCRREDRIRPDSVYRALAVAIHSRIPAWSAGRGPRAQ